MSRFDLLPRVVEPFTSRDAFTVCVFGFRRKGLKTGMYYLRTKAAVDAIKFTVDAKAAEAAAVAGEKTTVDSGETNAPPECISCGA